MKKYSFVVLLALAGIALSCLHGYGQTPEVYKIKRPDVTRSELPFPYILLNAYDTLLITAGGCVQTGGQGLTWKRYLKPQGPGSDRLYYALVNVTGFTSNWERLSDYVNHRLPMPQNVRRSVFRLGYRDDDLSDNGYYKKDNGINGQCLGQPDAWVTITIWRARR
jgi:hypothetical protein